MTAAYIMATLPVAYACSEWVACLLDEWEATKARRLTVLRRLGRAA